MIPAIIEFDYRKPEEVLISLSDQPGLCFLDSSKKDKKLGRFSYIAVDPFELIHSKNGSIFIKGEMFAADPFDYLNNRLSLYPAKSIKDLPPFQGGAIGYFAYDLLHHLENIPKPKKDILNVPDMMIGLYDVLVAFDNEKEKAWIISQGFPETEVKARQRRATDRAQWMKKKLESVHNISTQWVPESDALIQSNFTHENYLHAAQKVIDYIYEGDIFQANISQCFSSRIQKNQSALSLYLALRKKNPAPFSAFLQFEDLYIASASPERFIQLDNINIQTRPIKGTRRRDPDPLIDVKNIHDLINSEKDLAENTMIVDLMRNDFSRVCTPDSIHVAQLCGLESYETVHHLVSVIEGKLQEGLNAIDVLKACFPGGSITGAPKIRAMEIIHEIEPSSRGPYCGSIGYIGFDGNMDTSITIRTYTIKNDQIFFQAGGGIVSDSDPETEYQESLIKADALRKILQGEEVHYDSHD